MRKLKVAPSFLRGCELYATEPDEAEAVREAIALLEIAAASDASDALPIPDDTIDLPTPYATFWAHHLPKVGLVITYTFTSTVALVQTLRLDLRADLPER